MTKPTVLNPTSLPSNDNINPYAFCVDLDGQWFLSKGAMIAFYGQMRFEALTAATSLAGVVAQRFSSPLYTADWVVVSGRGKLVLGDRGRDLNSFDLDDGNLTIRAANLLAFEPTLSLKQSIVPGFVTLIGTGRFVASSNGPVIFAEPPMRVDPQALVGWADCPSPSHHFDANWMAGFLGAALGALGRQSGEERQFDFTGAGTILLQSSELVLEDPAVLRMVEEQTQLLGVGQLQRLQQVIAARIAQEQGSGP
jgi:uncharacterized protein (AIM24 family)